MSCPNCGSRNMWDDNMHAGCSDCGWCSLAGINKTRTPSDPNNQEEVRLRQEDWEKEDRKWRQE